MIIVIGGAAFDEVKIEAFDFAMVDHQNADMADAPPNGHASAQALRLAPEKIDAIIEMLQRSGLAVSALMCGQGLKQHTNAINRRLSELQLERAPADTRVSSRTQFACAAAQALALIISHHSGARDSLCLRSRFNGSERGQRRAHPVRSVCRCNACQLAAAGAAVMNCARLIYVVFFHHALAHRVRCLIHSFQFLTSSALQQVSYR